MALLKAILGDFRQFFGAFWSLGSRGDVAKVLFQRGLATPGGPKAAALAAAQGPGPKGHALSGALGAPAMDLVMATGFEGKDLWA